MSTPEPPTIDKGTKCEEKPAENDLKLTCNDCVTELSKDVPASIRQEAGIFVVCSVNPFADDSDANELFKACADSIPTSCENDFVENYGVNQVPQKSSNMPVPGSQSSTHPQAISIVSDSYKDELSGNDSKPEDIGVDEAYDADEVQTGQPQHLVNIQDLSSMISTYPVPLTPRKKRPASRADWELFDTLVKSAPVLEKPSTPTTQDIPELDWASTPPLNNDFPSTPMPCTIPSTRPSLNTKVHSTPTRTVRESKRAGLLKKRSTSRSTKQDIAEDLLSQHKANDQNSDLLFPLDLYPSLSPQERENARFFHFVKGDIGLKNLKFFDLTKATPSFSKPDPEKLVAADRAARSSFRIVRDHVEKKLRTKEEASIIGENASFPMDHMSAIQERRPAFKKDTILANQANAQHIPISVGSLPISSATIDLGITLGLAEWTSKRFTRILPFNTIERMIEAPRQCVASKLSWDAPPNQRCSRWTGLEGHEKTQLLNKLQDLKDPLNLTASANYIQDLVSSLTCTKHHRSIATDQLKRLFDRYHDRCHDAYRNWKDFTEGDLEFVMLWLETLTRLPGEQFSRQRHVATQKCEVAITRCSQAGSEDTDIKNPPSSQRRKVSLPFGMMEKTVRTSVAQVIENIESSLTNQNMNEAAQTDIAVTTIVSVAVDQTAHRENAHCEQKTTQKANVVHTSRSSHTLLRNADNLSLSGHEQKVVQKSLVLARTTYTSPTTTVAGEADGTVAFSTSRMYSALVQSKAFSKFIPTQIVDIDFMGRTAKVSSTNRTSLSKERAKVSYEESVNALHQQFRWFFSGPSLNFSVNECIAQCLRKPLTRLEETVGGFIYMYWIVGSFDFVKIGMTSRSSAARLEEWRRDCGHDIQEFTTSEVGPPGWLPNAYRVEALIHAELREARLKEPACKKCSERNGYTSGHHEWFAVSAAHAQKVIMKWSKWTFTRPYVAGKLKSSISDEEMDMLCTPLPLSLRDVAAFTALKPLMQLKPPVAMERRTKWKDRLRPRKAHQRKNRPSDV